MTKQWILAGVIASVLFGIVGLVRLAGYLKLRRMRALVCPECQAHFQAPSLLAVRRWIEVETSGNSSAKTGFYLRCGRCNVEYRFTDRCELIGRAE